jgi:hypothetical protein
MSSARAFLSGVNYFLGCTTLYFQVSAIVGNLDWQAFHSGSRGIVGARGIKSPSARVSVPVALLGSSPTSISVYFARIGHFCDTITILRDGAQN